MYSETQSRSSGSNCQDHKQETWPWKAQTSQAVPRSGPVQMLTAKSRAKTMMPCGMSTCRASSASRRLPLLQWQYTTRGFPPPVHLATVSGVNRLHSSFSFPLSFICNALWYQVDIMARGIKEST